MGLTPYHGGGVPAERVKLISTVVPRNEFDNSHRRGNLIKKAVAGMDLTDENHVL